MNRKIFTKGMAIFLLCAILTGFTAVYAESENYFFYWKDGKIYISNYSETFALTENKLTGDLEQARNEHFRGIQNNNKYIFSDRFERNEQQKEWIEYIFDLKIVDLKEGAKVKLIDTGIASFSINEAEKRITYLKKHNKSDEKYDLMQLDISTISSKPVLIDSDVNRYYLTDNQGESIFYTKHESIDDIYYYHQGKKSVVARGLLLDVSFDGKKFLFADGTALYKQIIGKEKILIDNEYEDLLDIDRAFDTIFYFKKDGIYKKKGNEASQKITDKVKSIYEEHSKVYITPSKETFFVIENGQDIRIPYRDLIQDDLNRGVYNKLSKTDKFVVDNIRKKIRTGKEFAISSKNIYFYDGEKMNLISGEAVYSSMDISIEPEGTPYKFYEPKKNAEGLIRMLNPQKINKVRLSEHKISENLDNEIRGRLFDTAQYHLHQGTKKVWSSKPGIDFAILDLDGKIYMSNNTDTEEILEFYEATIDGGGVSKVKYTGAYHDAMKKEFSFGEKKVSVEIKKENGGVTLYVNNKKAGFTKGQIDFLQSAFSDTIIFFLYEVSARDGKADIKAFYNDKVVDVIDDLYDPTILFTKKGDFAVYGSLGKEQKSNLYYFDGNKLKTLDTGLGPQK
ncbi:MAG: hypothetical protein Q4D65_09760 [Peptostreptococcaceae bacterium]|nr:hypothetical protein [Peptostreptococcaceae bacterium]